MAGHTKYTVEYDGRTVSVHEYAKLTGESASTIRYRIRHGLPVDEYSGKRRASYDLNAAEKRYTENYGYRNGYSMEEISDMYGIFAGNEDELQILMDFTGLGLLQAEKLLKELKENRRKVS